VDFIIRENPFKSLKRAFPVEFAYPSKAQYVLHLTIPAGYTVDEMPEPVQISLGNGGGKLLLSCTKVSEREIHMVLKLNRSQLVFLPEAYNDLRQFFEIAASKIQAQLVLKKA
jgi:hypothetical protein